MTFRRTLYRLHLTFALIAVGGLTVIGASGAMLVFGREIDAMLSPQLFVVEPGKPPESLDKIVNAVKDRYPRETIYRVRLPQKPHDSLEVWLNSTTGQRVYVDPSNGRLLGSHDPRQSFTGWLRRIHVELLMGNFGRTLVGLFGIQLLILCVSGLWMWRPGWHRLTKVRSVPKKASLQVRMYLWHRSLGAVSAVLLIMSAGTGIAMTFDDAAQFVVSVVTQLPVPAKPPQTVISTPGDYGSLDSAARIAQSHLPAASIRWIWLPTPTNGTLVVRMRDPSEWHPNGKSYVYLDSNSHHVLGVIDASQATDVSKVTNYIYPLHTGELGIPATRIVVMSSGIGLVALGWMGTGSWWLRRRKFSGKSAKVVGSRRLTFTSNIK